MKKISSILDYPYPGLDPDVWGEDGKLLPEHKKLIEESLINFLQEEGIQAHDEWIKLIRIQGSITTYQFTFDSDIDIHIQIDLPKFIETNNPKWAEPEAHDFLRDFIVALNKRKLVLAGTQHPIEYFFETRFVNPEPLTRTGIYDVLNEEWLMAPVSVDKDYDMEEIKPMVMEEANKIAEEIDVSFGKIKRNLRRIEELEEVQKSWDSEQKQVYQQKLQERMQNLDNEIKDLVFHKDKMLKERRDYNPEGDAELKFKFLQKFGYFVIIKAFDKLLADDDKITQDELPEVEMIMEEASLNTEVEWTINKDAFKFDKKALSISAYWIEPNGELHEIDGLGTHRKWLNDNTELSFNDAISGGWMQMWHTPGKELSFYLDEIKSISNIVNDMIISYSAPKIFISDYNGGEHSIQVDYDAAIFDGIQKAVNKALQQKRMHGAKRSDFMPSINKDAGWSGQHKAKKTDYDYSCVMADMPNGIATKVWDWGKKTIPEEDIYEGTGDDADQFGREEDSHVTVLYGLHTSNVNDIKKLFEKESSPKIKLGEVKHFSTKGKPYDVIIVEIVSPDLKKLNKLLTDNLEYTTDFPKYTPHMTIAYVKTGKAEQYDGQHIFDGDEVEIGKIIFSPAEGDKTHFSLKKGDFMPSISLHAPTNKWQTDSDQQIPVDPDSAAEEETYYAPHVDKPRNRKWLKRILDFLRSEPEKEEKQTADYDVEWTINKKAKQPTTTWRSNEPFSPLPTTFRKDINEDNLNWRYPHKFMKRPRGPHYSNTGDVFDILLSKNDTEEEESKKNANVYTDREMEKYYTEQHEYNDSDGGGNVYHDWNQSTTDFPKPEDLANPKIRLDQLEKPVNRRYYPGIGSYEVTWVFSLPKE